MSIIDTLRGLSAAEDFFETLDVPFDPAILRVARLHILRRLGQYLGREALADLPEPAMREACRTALQQAYDDLVTSSPLAERLFKVHQDAVKPKSDESSAARAFVPLASLALPQKRQGAGSCE